MTSRRFVAPKLIRMATVAMLCASPALWAANLGDNIRTASNAGPFMDQITRYVRERVEKLAGSDPAAQSKAREDLVSEVAPPAPPAQLSKEFLAAYATAVNSELVKLEGHKDPRVRLNAAIVAAKVAEGAKNANLQPTIGVFMKDQSDAVVLWALRGAKPIIPHAVAAGSAKDFTSIIIDIGRNRPHMARVVYDTLALSGDKNVLAEAIRTTQEVLRARIDRYKTNFPPEPVNDTRATTYLVGQTEYNAHTEAQKLTTAQLISDLLSMAAQRSADVTPQERAELAATIINAGKAMVVVGQREKSVGVEQTGMAIANIFPATATAQELQAAVKPVHGALKAVPRFSKITPPPTIGAMASDGGGGDGNPGTSAGAGNGPR